MSEIDRFVRSAQLDPYTTRKLERLDEVALSLESKRKVLRSRVRDLMLMLFNEPAPYERLSAICGRSPEYWQGQIGTRCNIDKTAVRLLTDGLRSHVLGLRDHLNDVDRSIAELTTILDQRGLFQPQLRRAGRRKART